MPVALCAVGVVGAAPGDVTTMRDGPIVAVAVAGSVVSAAVEEGAVECRHAEIWNAAANKATHLGKKAPCDAPGGIRGPAIVGNRAVWATNVGGNLRDWTVWTATTTSPAPKALAKVNGVDASDPDPVVIGTAGDGLVAYAVGTAVTAIRANGSTAWKWTAPTTVTLVGSGDADPQGKDLTHVGTADGKAAGIDASGKVLYVGTSDGVNSLCLHKKVVMAMKGGSLLLPGSPPNLTPLPANARLVGCYPDIAIYRVGTKVSGLRVSTGKTAVLLTGTKVVAVSAKGFAWATGRTLHWRPVARALKPLG